MQLSPPLRAAAWSCALLVAACATHRTADDAEAPRKRPHAVRVFEAPQGTLRVEEVETPRAPKPRALELVEPATQTVLWAFAFDGKVDVLWAPDGAAFAINEWIGDGIAVLTVVETRPPNHSYLLNELVPQDAHVTDNEQVWVEGQRWVDPRHLELRVRSRGKRDPEGFERSLVYAVGGSVTDR